MIRKWKSALDEINIIGQKFGRFLVLNYEFRQNSYNYFRVKCDCGTERVVRDAHLQNKRTKSCGCLKQDMNKERVGKKNPNYFHGHYTELREFCKIIRKRDIVCQRCDMTREENGRELDTHHFDGDNWNNNLTNGAALCHKCHMIVTANGNVWRPS